MPPMTRRKWFLVGGLVLVLAVVGFGYKGIAFFIEASYWEREMGHGEGHLRVGDMAPDFELQFKKSEETVRLSAFRGEKPVALIFGSYT